MITISGRAATMPFSMRVQANQSSLRSRNSELAMPRATPPTIVIGTDLRPPIRAAANAGTISAVNPTGVIGPWIGPTRIAANVTSIDAPTQLAAANRCGE